MEELPVQLLFCMLCTHSAIFKLTFISYSASLLFFFIIAPYNEHEMEDYRQEWYIDI